METEKENKINLEEFMLKQLDWSLEMKARLESKATGYLAITTLSLSLVFQMMMNSKVTLGMPKRHLTIKLSKLKRVLTS